MPGALRHVAGGRNAHAINCEFDGEGGRHRVPVFGFDEIHRLRMRASRQPEQQHTKNRTE